MVVPPRSTSRGRGRRFGSLGHARGLGIEHDAAVVARHARGRASRSSRMRRVTGLPPSTATAVPSMRDHESDDQRHVHRRDHDDEQREHHEGTGDDERQRRGAPQADDDQRQRGAQREEQEDRQHGDEERLGDHWHAVSLSRRPSPTLRRGPSSVRTRAGTAASSGLSPAALARRLTAVGVIPRRAAMLCWVSPRRAGRRPPTRASTCDRAGRRAAADRLPRPRPRRSGEETATRPIAPFALSTASRAWTNAEPRAALMSAGSGVSTAPTPRPTLHRAVAQQREPDRERGRGAAGERLEFVARIALDRDREPPRAGALHQGDALGNEVDVRPAVALVRGDDEHRLLHCIEP